MTCFKKIILRLNYNSFDILTQMIFLMVFIQKKTCLIPYKSLNIKSYSLECMNL